MCLSIEARDLVKALLQSDPTVRLSAEQTLLHPWVKAMASACRQGALRDKAQKNTAGTGAEPDRVRRLADTKAAETMTDKTLGHTSREGGISHKEASTPDERQAQVNAGGGKIEDKSPQQQSEDTSISHTISPQFKVCTPSEATPSQQRPDCTSAERKLQDPGPRSSNTDCDPGSSTSPGVEFNQLLDPQVQTEPPSQIKPQSKQNSQQQPPPRSPPSSGQAQQTREGHSMQHPPSSSLTAASSSHPLHKQNLASPLHKPTAQNHSAENHCEQNIHTTITHPSTQS